MEFLIIFLLALVNGVFAMAEAALISSRRVRLNTMAERGTWGARAALKLANDPQKFLPTVQIGITVVSIVTGIYGGTEVAQSLSEALKPFPVIQGYAEGLVYVVTVTIITYVSIIFGELVPKTIGIAKPEQVAILLAPLMQLLYYLTAPFIWLLSISTKLVLRVFRFTQMSREPSVTEEEVKHLIEQGRQSGILEKQQSDMMRSIFHTADRKVGSLMTHRNEVLWLDLSAGADEALKLIRDNIHTNYPVCDGSLDQVAGLVSTKDLLVQISAKQTFHLVSLLKKPIYVPESMPALELLDSFRMSHQQVALVLNEYGALEGIVTLHDVVEAVFGDMPISPHSEDPAFRRTDGSWLLDGMMSTSKWSDVVGLGELHETDTGTYNTLGGFVLHQLGRIPATGDHFSFRTYDFEVVDMDGRRVDKVMVKKH